MSNTSTNIHITDEQRNNHIQAQGRTFIWHQIYGATEQASLDFYTKALDWGTEKYEMGEAGTYNMLTANGSSVAGVVSTQDAKHPELKDVPPHWAITIGVDDVDARAKKCESLGATVLQGPFDIPNIGRIALLKDPQGAMFWLMKPAM